ncbi:MAG: hypothetical protein K1X53_09355 [Candidatus Sumerlaeaceae bacterium]|nr:hypothetical protein [Candidatus Sumerlaeaceae bacterium]
MRCLECHRTISIPSLVIAMEQREHFSLVRHTEVCAACTEKIYSIIHEHSKESRFLHQSMNCVLCNCNLPITRLRFDLKDRAHLHVSICEPCYRKMRDELLVAAPNMVSFIEKEWISRGMKSHTRTPWPINGTVKVRQNVARFGGHFGIIKNYRGLVQPWYGYDVRLDDGQRHFFHERDLDLTTMPNGEPAPDSLKYPQPPTTAPAPQE